MKKKLFLLGVIGLLMPFNISALSGSVSLSCDKAKLNVGESTTCTIKGNITDGSVSAVSAKVELSENLSLVSIETDSSWQGDGEDGNIELYTDDNKNGEFNIGTFVVKAGNNYGVSTSVSLKNVTLSDASFSEQSFTVSSYDIRIPSNINTLSMIKIDDENMLGFSSDELSYKFDTNYSLTNIKISATTTDSTAKISGDTGSKVVSYGTNKYTIKVTAENGDEKEYIITVVKHEGRELKTLKINGKEIDLINGKYDYNLDVENKVDKISIEASLKNDHTSFVDKYGNREEKLEVGNNEFFIKTKDENNEELTYKIMINRLAADDNEVPDDKDVVDDNSNDTNLNDDNSDIKNPNTGAKISVITGSIVLISLCLIFVIMRKKDFFKKI